MDRPLLSSPFFQGIQLHAFFLMSLLLLPSSFLEAKVREHAPKKSSTSIPQIQKLKKSFYPEHHFRLKKKLVEHLLVRPLQFSMSARIMPHYKKGHAVGFKFVWIRKDSIFEKLGMLNNDIVRKVNGKTAGVGTALGIYSQLPYAKSFRLQLERGGRTHYFVYHIGAFPKQRTVSLYVYTKNIHVPAPRKILLKPKKRKMKRGRKKSIYAHYPKLRKTTIPGVHLIQRIQPNCSLVPALFFTRVSQRLDLLAAQAAIVPYFMNGKAKGFRIYRIKKGSVYERLGFKNGDVIMKVNGYNFTSPQKALEAYSNISSSKSFVALLLRKGRSMELGVVTSRGQPCTTKSPRRPASRPGAKKVKKTKPTSRPTRAKKAKK